MDLDIGGSQSIDALYSLVRDARTVNWNGMAATACLIYDIFITFDQEVEFIWKRQWSIPCFLFLFARYFTLAVQLVNAHESTSFTITDTYCHNWTFFMSISGQLIFMSVEISLMLRVYALYKRDRRILALLVALYIAEVAANTTILGLGLTQIVSVARLHTVFPPDFPLTGCFPVFIPGFFYSYWIPTLLFESALFIMVAVNFIRVVRMQKLDVPILTLFFKDGTVFYAVIFATLLTEVMLYQLVNSALAQVAIGWQFTIFSIANSRLILHLRSSNASRTTKGWDSDTSKTRHIPLGPWSTSTVSGVSDIEFVRRPTTHGVDVISHSETILGDSDTRTTEWKKDAEFDGERWKNDGKGDWLEEWGRV